jgi:hypothetical protein
VNVQVIVDRPVRLFYQPSGPKSDHKAVDLKPLEVNAIKLEVWEAILSNPTQRQVVENLAESKILEWTDESTAQKMVEGSKPFPQPSALDAEKEAAKIGQEKLAAAFKKK